SCDGPKLQGSAPNPMKSCRPWPPKPRVYRLGSTTSRLFRPDYIADGGAPVLVRVVARRADAISDFGDARLWSETTRIDLRVAEVVNPRPGDRLEIEGEAFLIQGEPVRDRERLVWTIDLRPA
ncbi:hypothetical protein, partial [Cereibacter azotoformans]|uniref:head-tail joining protein n=1 Tax=Cereibacter azotoformans TaxID=43057 RepID=UPI001F17A6AF